MSNLSEEELEEREGVEGEEEETNSANLFVTLECPIIENTTVQESVSELSGSFVLVEKRESSLGGSEWLEQMCISPILLFHERTENENLCLVNFRHTVTFRGRFQVFGSRGEVEHV